MSDPGTSIDADDLDPEAELALITAFRDWKQGS
jgi:hypothetical protein